MTSRGAAPSTLRTLLTALALALAVAALSAVAASAPPAPRPAEAPGVFRFSRLNRSYSQPGTAIDPIVAGPLTVRLSSPRNKLVLASHLLRLEPGADGLHTADLSVRFYGKGWVVADVEVSGVEKRFEEEVLVPPQTRRIEGRVKVERRGGGYLLTPERLPRELRVTFESRFGNDIVDLCERLASLPFSELDCTGLDRALSTAAVPLPPAGEGFFLAPSDLTPDERRQIEAYLGVSGSPRGAPGGRRPGLPR